jgi:hypothetical protein
MTFILFLIISQTYSQQFFDFNTGGIREERYYSEIPYSKAGGLVIVEVEISGKKYKFMLDTGASGALSTDAYNVLNIQPIKKSRITDSNGKSDSLIIALIPNIKLGELNFFDTPVTVIPENDMFKCFGIDGIIGSSMLRNSIIRFSSKDSTVTITNISDRLKLDKKKSSEIELIKNQSLPIIKIIAKNKKTAREPLLFDSGMTGLYQISMGHFNVFNKRKMFTDLIQSNGGGDVGIYGNGKDTLVYFGRIPQISINQVQFKNISTTTTIGGERIGAKLFDYGIVSIDFINKRFYFESFEKSYDLYKKELPFDIMVENGKILIATVWDKKMKDQIKRGDQIIAVNGTNCEKIETCKLLSNHNYLKFKESNELTIQTSDGNQKTIMIKKDM